MGDSQETEGAEAPPTSQKSEAADILESTPDTPVRRSSRRRAPPTAFEEQQASGHKPAPKDSDRRRNPKRKASEPVHHNVGLPDELLDEALKPLAPQDIEEWEGWIELESEPASPNSIPWRAFFSTILRDLGVQHVKAHELWGVDQDSIDSLPKPVFGLIFLFEVIPGIDDGEGDDDPGDLWFANQTTNNACATVALLNIIMNAEGVELGDKLRDFKDETKGMCTALRGHYLSSNTFIRTIHNSFTRRMDHLNADLFLENQASEASSKSKKRTVSKKSSRKKKKKKNVDSDYGFHFVAYVPAHGHVWELDGLMNKPHKIGPIGSGDWTTVAQPHIQARMLQYAETQLAFNLLALCQSPLVSYSRDIAQAAASLRHLDARMGSQPAFSSLISGELPVLDTDDAAQLSEFQLSKTDIESAEMPLPLQRKIANPAFGVEEAYVMYQELAQEAKASMGEYRSEVMAMAADELKVQGRKKDYAPALHRWVKALADKGVLEDIINSSA